VLNGLRFVITVLQKVALHLNASIFRNCTDVNEFGVIGQVTI
jgi:hypothetical protein